MELSDRLLTTPVPYAPSSAWVAARMQCKKPDFKARDLARCRIYSKEDPIVLSIPLEGGASSLKRLTPDLIRLSEHGQWRRLHTRAITTTYRRFPFFDYVGDRIFPIYDIEFYNLEEFNEAIALKICECLKLNELASTLESMQPDQRQLYQATAKELMRLIHPELSVLDALFRLGPDATIPLIFALDEQL